MLTESSACLWFICLSSLCTCTCRCVQFNYMCIVYIHVHISMRNIYMYLQGRCHYGHRCTVRMSAHMGVIIITWVPILSIVINNDSTNPHSCRDPEICSRCGPDAVLYLTMERYLIVLMAIFSLLSLVVILPINYLQGNQCEREVQ